VRVFDWLKKSAQVARSKRADDPVSLLAITASHSDQAALARLAARSDWSLALSESLEDAVQLLAHRRFSIVLFDRDLTGDWREAMEKLARSAPGACILLTSAVNDSYLCEEVVQRGGYDVLTRPLQDAAVVHAIDHAWWYWKTSR